MHGGKPGSKDQPLDAVLNVFNADDPDKPDLPGCPDMGSGTRLDVAPHLHRPDIPARRNAALVETKPVLLLGLRPLLDVDIDRGIGHDHTVRLYLDPLEFLGRDMRIVPDVQTGDLAPLLGAGLVHVGAEHLLCGVQEDVGRRVMARQRQAALLVHHTLHPVAALQGAARDPVEDHLADFYRLLHPHHALGRHEGAGIGRLTAAFGVKERLVQHRHPVEVIEHHRLELDLARLLVVEFLRRGQGFGPLAVGGKRVLTFRLFLRFRVRIGDQRVKVVGDLHDGPLGGSDVLHHFGRNAVRVVEGDDLRKGNPRTLCLVVPGDLLDDPGPALEGACIPLLLVRHDLADHGDVLPEVLGPHDLHLRLHEVRQVLVHREIVHHPERPAEHEPGEIPFPDIRGNDAVAEHVGKAAGVVGDRIDLLDRDDDPLQPLHRHIDRLGDLPPEVVEIRPGDVHHPGEPGAQAHDLRELRVVEEVLQMRRTHQAAYHLREDRVVDRRRTL